MTPEGIYQGLLVNATYAKWGAKETPGMRLDFKCIAYKTTVSAGWEKLREPVDASVYLYTSDKSWEYTEAKLYKLGFNGKFREPQFADDTYESGVVLNCKHEDYNGKTQVRWDVSFGSAKPADDIDALEEKWRKAHPVELTAAGVKAKFEGEEIPL